MAAAACSEELLVAPAKLEFAVAVPSEFWHWAPTVPSRVPQSARQEAAQLCAGKQQES